MWVLARELTVQEKGEARFKLQAWEHSLGIPSSVLSYYEWKAQPKDVTETAQEHITYSISHLTNI